MTTSTATYQAPTLNIAQVSTRGNKYAIVCGVSVLRKFKTIKAAKEELRDNKSLYEYWAGSCSVAVDNSRKVHVIIDEETNTSTVISNLVYSLDDINIERAIQNQGINVKSCVQGEGEIKGIYITVASEDLGKAYRLFRELGIVDANGGAPLIECVDGEYTCLKVAYMAEWMYKELQEAKTWMY